MFVIPGETIFRRVENRLEDKRITKTKRNIKATLTDILQEMPFEKISVAEICRRGDISRITFYAHYEDKYALAEEIFSDHMQEANDKYHALQAVNNPKNDGFIGYQNLMEAILSLYYDNYAFFSHTTSRENPYLFSAYFNRMYISVDDYLRRHTYLKPRFSFHQTAALICNGLFGVINSCVADHLSESETRAVARGIYAVLLHSGMFEK